MKKHIIFSIIVFLTISCEKNDEILLYQYKNLFGTWDVINKTGGWTGATVTDFDVIEIKNEYSFKLIFEQEVIADGVIDIIKQTSSELKIDFKPNKTGICVSLLTSDQNVKFFGTDTISFNDGVLDGYSYKLSRSNTLSIK